jgi:hypothetical protein
VAYIPWAKIRFNKGKNDILRKIIRMGHVFPPSIRSLLTKSSIGPIDESEQHCTIENFISWAIQYRQKWLNKNTLLQEHCARLMRSALTKKDRNLWINGETPKAWLELPLHYQVMIKNHLI